jgi:glucuronate isomerase
MKPSQPLRLDPDRLFPADPSTRSKARALYESVAELSIFSPHGHIDARMLVDDEPFVDPVTLLISPDHYVTRILHSGGVPLDVLGVGDSRDGFDPREAWRLFCSNWPAFRGTASGYWLQVELVEIFGVETMPSADNADELYDQISERLRSPEFRPRALFDRFNIDVLATTDDPADDLAAHAALSADPSFRSNVIPTFRPDAYLDPSTPGWVQRVHRLAEITGFDTEDYDGFLDALRERRWYFVERGAAASDHGMTDAGIGPIEHSRAVRLHALALRGQLTKDEAAAYRRGALMEMARMSTEDGLVMQVHPGVLRDHHLPTYERFGRDTGHDIPTLTAYAEPLRPLLQELGIDPRFRMVLFTVDETAFARDIAPLAGFYPSVYVGAPWWFLDAPDSILRFRSRVTESAGFSRSAGFVDDTRAFCSIPARHDMSRRLDAAYLARLVAEHRLTEQEAQETIHEIVVDSPRRVFSRTVQSSHATDKARIDT